MREKNWHVGARLGGKKKSTAWARWLFPRQGVGGVMAFCHAPVSRRTCSQAHWAVRYTWQAHWRQTAVARGTRFTKWGELRDWYVE